MMIFRMEINGTVRASKQKKKGDWMEETNAKAKSTILESNLMRTEQAKALRGCNQEEIDEDPPSILPSETAFENLGI